MEDVALLHALSDIITHPRIEIAAVSDQLHAEKIMVSVQFICPLK